MNNPIVEHPNEEALERFLLNRSEDQELEVLETHILACESCIIRLETLELQMADLKVALAKSEEVRLQKELDKKQPFWKGWFTMSSLSWAGAACAALALGLTMIPHSIRTTRGATAAAEAAQGDLSACSGSDATSLASCRGVETATLPENRPLNLRLDTTDIPEGKVDVEVVNSNGGEVWKGNTTVSNEHAQVNVPGISEPGPYFLRFYTAGGSSERELLREFRFEVK